MLGRRNLRIKVMQMLYMWETDRDIKLTSLESKLETQIAKSFSLYLTNLLYLVEVCQYSMVDKAKRLAKYVQTEEDNKASTTIAANSIVQFLLNDATFNSFVDKEKVRNYVVKEDVKKLFSELSAKPKYLEYAALQTTTIEQDKDIVTFILKKIFASDKTLEQHLEEAFINYDDDNALILHILCKQIDSVKGEINNIFFQNMEVWEDEKKFALNLLAKTVQHNEEFTASIEPNLRNWEMDRVAVLDLILMKMAVCELKYFPTIPVKVSINEYIDISKLYSTPKSKDFVNGVLDKVKNEMKEAGTIKKHGRGLME